MLSESIINAIINHAEQGNQIAVITKDTQGAFNRVAQKLEADYIDRASRANGQELIRLINGGQITFHRTPDHLRGRRAHLVVAPMNMSEDDRMTVIPTVATTHGEIIGCM